MKILIVQFTEKEYCRKAIVITDQPCIYFNKTNIAGCGNEDIQYVKSSMLPQRIYAACIQNWRTPYALHLNIQLKATVWLASTINI